MSIDVSIAIIVVLIILLLLQLSVLFFVKKFISRLSLLLSKISPKTKPTSKKTIRYNSLSTCQNCQFRQTYLTSETEDIIIFTYKCKFDDNEIMLEDSCSKFELEHTKTK